MEAGITDPFVGFGDAAKAKVVLLGSMASSPPPVRSWNLEHVSPSRLLGPEISRRAADSAAAEQGRCLALMRHWFFSRKPDAGFVLTDFPATLLQAKVFDEWLETRDEKLSAVVVLPNSLEAIVTHYRTLGLIRGAVD